MKKFMFEATEVNTKSAIIGIVVAASKNEAIEKIEKTIGEGLKYLYFWETEDYEGLTIKVKSTCEFKRYEKNSGN